MEAAGALGAAAPILESISTPPPRGAGWSWFGCGCQKDPISDQILTCLVLHIGVLNYSCYVVLGLNRPRR